jgi:hypothetical protein
MATEQKAFAAVHENGTIDITTISSTAKIAKFEAGKTWPDGWEEAYRQGWRIRPVIIRLEEQDNG